MAQSRYIKSNQQGQINKMFSMQSRAIKWSTLYYDLQSIRYPKEFNLLTITINNSIIKQLYSKISYIVIWKTIRYKKIYRLMQSLNFNNL